MVLITPGCYLNVDTSALVAFYSRTISYARSASVTFTLPDDPVFLGNYYMQWIWYDNRRYYMTLGLRAQVRS